jgi:DNA-binding transcriptional ArsR family regulator
VGYDTVLEALGDPTRRLLLEQLREGPCAVAGLAAKLPVTRPAVSQHLKILKNAGLVSDKAYGTRRIYQVDTSGLAALQAWLDSFRGQMHDFYRAEIQRQLDERKST